LNQAIQANTSSGFQFSSLFSGIRGELKASHFTASFHCSTLHRQTPQTPAPQLTGISIPCMAASSAIFFPSSAVNCHTSFHLGSLMITVIAIFNLTKNKIRLDSSIQLYENIIKNQIKKI
jgi:hypothetical protein